MVMDVELSVAGGLPDSILVQPDDVIQQAVDRMWDYRRLALDGIVLSYTMKPTDNETFTMLQSGSWCPHYIICAGGGDHPLGRGTKTFPGQIFQLVGERYRAFHCVDGTYRCSGFIGAGGERTTPDQLCIGISIVGVMGAPLLSQQIQAAGRLVRDILSRNQSITTLVGRRHVTYNPSLNRVSMPDPEPTSVGAGRIDFSDSTLFGRVASPLMNRNIAWKPSGTAFIYEPGYTGEI